MSDTHQWLLGTLLVAVVAAAPAYGGEFSLHGRASGWLGAGRDSSYRVLAGARYLPDANLSLPITEELVLDAEASVNAFVSVNVRPFDSPALEARIKPYRGLVRLSAARFEVRAGLQKINFGSATLLRPLQWFDRVDPRDPLELTDGVYGMLGRYYFQNNMNIWVWGLLGNSSLKGWEQVGSDRWAPEPGGRVQIPVPRGEIAATYHHRLVDYSGLTFVPEMLPEQAEDRVGLDAKLDVGVGLSFEGVLVRAQHRMDYGEEASTWTHLATVGLDYTLGVGSGLGVAAEHMLVGSARAPFGSEGDANLSAVSLGLPLGLLDNLKGILYYDWSGHEFYRFAGWQRTLDKWIFSVTAFWNPDRAPTALAGPPIAAAGKGVQLMVVYNH